MPLYSVISVMTEIKERRDEGQRLLMVNARASVLQGRMPSMTMTERREWRG
jgi:hypothetical protein